MYTGHGNTYFLNPNLNNEPREVEEFDELALGVSSKRLNDSLECNQPLHLRNENEARYLIHEW